MTNITTMTRDDVTVAAIHQAGHVVAGLLAHREVGEEFAIDGVEIVQPGEPFEFVGPADCIFYPTKVPGTFGRWNDVPDFGAEMWPEALVGMITVLGGLVAEESYTAHELRIVGGGRDLASANAIARDFSEDEDSRAALVDRLRRRTRDLIKGAWPAVVALADALVERRSIPGVEAIAIVERALIAAAA